MSRRLRALARRWRSRPERQASLLVLAGLAAFVLGVYVVVVVGGGLLVGDGSSPNLGLSVVATALVALGFEPVQVRLQRLASRVVRGGRPSPYDVLSRSAAATGAYPAEELPLQVARVLAEGTGARWSQLWLDISGGLVLAATWPPAAEIELPAEPPGYEADPTGLRSLPVLHRGEQLGVLRLAERDRQPLTSVEERLFAGLAAQAGLVLRGARLRAELAGRLAELSAREAELRASRQRLVDTQDDERRLLERDIHDGAQQHLVALAVNLRLAETLATKAPERAVPVLAAQAGAARVAIGTLTDLSRGIYPPLLGDAGLLPALRAAVATSPVPVTVSGEGIRRYPAPVEAALYFCCLEALQNAAKHSGATRVEVRLTEQDGVVELVVADDGRGFAADRLPTGSGLANMRDRLDSVGGTLSVRPGSSGGVAVHGAVPARAALPVVAP